MKKLLVLLFAILGLLAGCNGGSTAISVSASSSSTTVQAGGTAQITATIANDSSNKGVTWAVTCSSASCGSVSPTSSTMSPYTTTYSAPDTPPLSQLAVTITATSVADSTKSASVSITVLLVSISVSPSTAEVEAKDTEQFMATVSGAANTGVTWALTKGTTACSPTCGTLSSTTANPVTYTAPATPPASDLALTLTATADADSTKSASATITVPAITVTIAPSTVVVLVNTTHNFTATVENDPLNAGVTWSLTQSGTACSPTCGSLSSATTNPVTYTAPAALPTSPTVTLTATSKTDGTKTWSATITLTTVIAEACGTGSESLLNGQYAFLLKGSENASPGNPALIGGVIVLDGNGNVAVGSMDMNLPAGVRTDLSVIPASSSYSVGPDHRGCMTLTTSAGTQDYRFALGGISSGAASTGHMIDFDTTGPFTSGVILKQTASSSLDFSGNYAFGVSSIQNSKVGGGKIGAVGVIDLATTGSVTGVEDFNFNGQLDGNSSNTVWPTSPVSITGGTYSYDALDGRATMTLTPSGFPAVHDVVYVISASKVLLMSIDDQTTSGITAGTALKQTSGPFSSSWLNGTGVYYESSPGSGGAGTTRARIGLMSGSGTSGNFTITTYQNQSGVFSFENGVPATFTIDSSTGRVLTSGTGAGIHAPVLYVVNTNEAFLLDSNGSADSGYMQPQSGTFSASSIKGAFATGSINPESSTVIHQAGVVTFDGISNVIGTLDDNSAGTLAPDSVFNRTYSVDSSGLARIPSGCTVSASSTTCVNLVLFITPTKAVEVDVGPTNTNPVIDPTEQ